MPSRLLVVNVVLAGISLLCVGLIVKQLVSAPATVASRPRSGAAAPAAPPAAEPQRLPAQAYSMIASRNLFSPTRTETPGTGLAGGPTINIVKPSLHGVVLRDGAPIAYLEDPLTKRIAGYRIGDPIAGGTVQTISADAVVIARPDGVVDVRLRDPSKPRPPAPTPAGQPPVPGQAPVPGPFPAPGGVQPPTPIPQPAPRRSRTDAPRASARTASGAARTDGAGLSKRRAVPPTVAEPRAPVPGGAGRPQQPAAARASELA
jgi:hypothetical protein